MGNALQMYTQDYDESFHKGAGMITTAANGFGAHSSLDGWFQWPWFYGPYVKNAGIFDCPTAPDKAQDTLAITDWGNGGNYGYNYSGLTRDQGTPPRSLAEIDQPADTFVFFDSGDPAVVEGTNDWPKLLEELDLNLNCSINTIGAAYSKECALRHSGRVNVAFVDGHAKSLSWSTFLTRRGDNVYPWMINWSDCGATCPDPLAGAGQCFDPAKVP